MADARSLQVAHVTFSLECGGSEQGIIDLVREGIKLGQRVSVVCLERPGTLAPQAEALGASVYCLHKRPGVRLGLVRQLKPVLREVRPDVVHTHQIGALFYCGPAARSAGVPLVIHTERGKHYSERWRTRWLGRLAARHARRFCCISEDIAAEVRAHRIAPRRKVHVVPNGIDTARFRRMGDTDALRRALGIPSGVPVVGTLGRLSEEKRQDTLLYAFAHVRRRVPQARLLIVGDGPLRGELHRLAADLDLAQAVHFAGYQEQPERFLEAMTVFALTSRSEGQPRAVLEAWAAGLPVAASRVGGLPEMIDDGATGRLFECGDATALSAIVCELLARPLLTQRLAEAGRRQVEARYDSRRVARDYQRHYQELLPS